jgi:hypothetical protein
LGWPHCNIYPRADDESVSFNTTEQLTAEVSLTQTATLIHYRQPFFVCLNRWTTPRFEINKPPRRTRKEGDRKGTEQYGRLMLLVQEACWPSADRVPAVISADIAQKV